MIKILLCWNGFIVFGLILMYGFIFIMVIFNLWVFKSVVIEVVEIFLFSDEIILLVMKIKWVIGFFV